MLISQDGWEEPPGSLGFSRPATSAISIHLLLSRLHLHCTSLSFFPFSFSYVLRSFIICGLLVAILLLHRAAAAAAAAAPLTFYRSTEEDRVR